MYLCEKLLDTFFLEISLDIIVVIKKLEIFISSPRGLNLNFSIALQKLCISCSVVTLAFFFEILCSIRFFWFSTAFICVSGNTNLRHFATTRKTRGFFLWRIQRVLYLLFAFVASCCHVEFVYFYNQLLGLAAWHFFFSSLSQIQNFSA